SYFHPHRTHPPLHPFPTRRSSDLPARVSRAGVVRQGGRLSAQGLPATPPPHRHASPAWGGCGEQEERLSAAVRAAGMSFASLRRSEEHTSELQSRGHLVCRLLLEK